MRAGAWLVLEVRVDAVRGDPRLARACGGRRPPSRSSRRRTRPRRRAGAPPNASERATCWTRPRTPCQASSSPRGAEDDAHAAALPLTGETAAQTTRGNSRKRAPSRAERSDGPLTADDWIEAAMDILAEDNVAGVQTSALCQKLHVTKGSFYWHFKALGDLLHGVLDSWRRRTTLNVINRFTKPGDD